MPLSSFVWAVNNAEIAKYDNIRDNQTFFNVFLEQRFTNQIKKFFFP